MAAKYNHELVCLNFPQIPAVLKAKQTEIINGLVDDKKDVVGILPTGYGKSLTFVLPALFTDNITVVISPLKTLMLNQKFQLEEWGVRALVINEDTPESVKKELAEGATGVHVILVTPESILSEDGLKLFKLIKDRVGVICVDEVHLLHTWGNFRPMYRRLGLLRSQFVDARVLMLSATVTQLILEDVLHHLHVSKDNLVIVSASIDRPNLRIHVHSRAGMTFIEDIRWLLDIIRDKGAEMPKTIIFARTAINVSRYFMDLLTELHEKAYANQVFGDREFLMVETFHSEVYEEDHRRILSEFQKPDSVIRLIISTDSLSTGVHFDDVRYVISYGTPDSIVQFWQQAGRAGRDNILSFCYLYATRHTYHKREDCIRDFVKAVIANKLKCARHYLLALLYVHGMPKIEVDHLHAPVLLNCCSINAEIQTASMNPSGETCDPNSDSE